MTKYKLGRRFAKIKQGSEEKMPHVIDPGDQTFFRPCGSSLEGVQVEQENTAGEDATGALSSQVHCGGQVFPGDGITLQHEDQEEENSEVVERFIELDPVDLVESQSRFKSLLITARSTLRQMMDLTHRFKDNGNLEELSHWVDSIGNSLQQAEAFVSEDGFILDCTNTSVPPSKTCRPSHGIPEPLLETEATPAAYAKVDSESTLQASTQDLYNSG